MGSLCCVAARPQETNAESRDGSVGPREPYWRTNTSFSPPSRCDFNGVNDGIRFYDSSTSSNNKASHTLGRSGNFHHDHHYTVSDGSVVLLSSPSDLSQGPQWTPPSLQDLHVSDYESMRMRDQILTQIPFTPTVEGTSRNVDIGGSFSSFSDSGESEYTARAHSSSHGYFSSRRFLFSKAIHPLSFPSETVKEASDFADTCSWSSASSSIETMDITESIESVNSTLPSSKTFKCGFCDRFLSQRSPWSSHRIIRSGDMPITGVLPCRHVFHADCLDQTTSKTQRNDPPCPICTKREGENSSLSRVRNNFPRLKPFREDVPCTRPWGCAQVGDCVESALNVPPRTTMMVLNKNRVKKNLSLKGNSSKNNSYMTAKLSNQISIGRSTGKEKASW